MTAFGMTYLNYIIYFQPTFEGRGSVSLSVSEASLLKPVDLR